MLPPNPPATMHPTSTAAPAMHTVRPEPYTYREIKTALQFLQTLAAGPFVWPGGYPLYFITADGAALSFAAAAEQQTEICEDITDNEARRGWQVIGCQENWEDGDLYCDHTGQRIESAYAEPEE